MAQDNIIRFPGSAAQPPSKPAAAPAAAVEPGLDGLTDDQRKAIQLIIAGYSFVLVAIKPSDRGADFYTAVHGDPTDLRNAQPHLAGVIDRLYARRGI